MDKANGELGQSEVPGEDHNVRILAYHLETSLRATNDETPWCSSFICAMFEWSKIPSTRSAAARSWLEWGAPLDRPIYGCVAILSRGKSPKSGHVGLYLDEDLASISIIGGNQGNKVSIKRYHKDLVLGYRWPLEEHWSEIDVKDPKAIG